MTQACGAVQGEGERRLCRICGFDWRKFKRKVGSGGSYADTEGSEIAGSEGESGPHGFDVTAGSHNSHNLWSSCSKARSIAIGCSQRPAGHIGHLGTALAHSCSRLADRPGSSAAVCPIILTFCSFHHRAVLLPSDSRGSFGLFLLPSLDGGQ